MTHKSTLAALLMALTASAGCNSNDLKDKLYLDDQWNVIQSPEKASYYRMYNASDKSEGPKPFRDYYMSGVLQSEGNYLTMDASNNMAIKVDGLINFYTEKGVKYIVSNYKNGIMHGTSTNYDRETGKLYSVEEYRNDTLFTVTKYDESGRTTDEYTRITDSLTKVILYDYDDKGDLQYKALGEIDANNKRQGYWEVYEFCGNSWDTIRKYSFVDDMLEGQAVQKELSSETEATGNYTHDEKTGTWTYTYFYDKCKQVTNYDNSKEPTRFYTLDGKPFTGRHTETMELNEGENADDAEDTKTITVKNSYIQDVTYTNSKSGKVMRTIKYKNGLPADK